jgi:hypothetical protein
MPISYAEAKAQARELGIPLTERVNTGKKNKKGQVIYRNHPKSKGQLLYEIFERRLED